MPSVGCACLDDDDHVVVTILYNSQRFSSILPTLLHFYNTRTSHITLLLCAGVFQVVALLRWPRTRPCPRPNRIATTTTTTTTRVGRTSHLHNCNRRRTLVEDHHHHHTLHKRTTTTLAPNKELAAAAVVVWEDLPLLQVFHKTG